MIVGLYTSTLVLIAVLAIAFAYLSLSLGILPFLFASIALAFIDLIFLSLLLSFHQTKYIVTDEDLVIKTTRLIALTKEKRISITKIKSIERTLIPWGLRLFGASFYGGYHYIPGLGRAFIVTTNFNDGVLVKTEKGNYIITPRDPDEFIRVAKGRIEELTPSV